MAINLIETTRQELDARKEICDGVKDVISWKIANICTCCRKDIKSNILSGNVRTHPLLGTLICQKCEDFYGNPCDFSVDEDGSDKYCRWCGQGGMIYACSKCPRAFCKKCIKSNISRTFQSEVVTKDWLCYFCNSKPLWELRTAAFLAQEYANSIIQRKRSRKGSVDDDYRPSHEKKPKRVGKSEAIPTVKHAYSGARKFNSYIETCTSYCQKYIDDLDDLHQRMRRVVTSAESALPVLKDLTSHFDKLVSNINSSTKTLQEEITDWEAEWKNKVKEEKDMEARGELVDGRIVISKKKKVNKKLAATAGGGDSSDEGNSVEEEEAKKSERPMAIKSPKKRYLAANDDLEKVKSDGEDEDAPKLNGKSKTPKRKLTKKESSSEGEEPMSPRGKEDSNGKYKTPKRGHTEKESSSEGEEPMTPREKKDSKKTPKQSKKSSDLKSSNRHSPRKTNA